VSDNPFGGGGDGFDARRHRSNGSNGSNGSQPRGMDTRPVPFDDIEDPIDLVAVQADDELINALAAGMTVSSPGIGGYDADDRVAAILAAWKADVDAQPIPELVDVGTAVSAVVAARPRSRRARHLAPIAAAAAFIVLAIGGLSVGSYSAQPSDALWAVSKVLYSERAQSVEAAVRVEDRIASAKQALVAGEPVRAARELAQAEADLAVVRPEEGLVQLAETQDFLVAKAAETPPGQPTDPGSPLVMQPSRQVPSGASSPVRPSPQSGTHPGTSPQVSSTSGPTGPTGPETSGTPNSPGPNAPGTNDPRRGAVAPESSSSTSTTTPSPATSEGEPSTTGPTGSPRPTATSEGSATEPTTTPGHSGNTTPSSSGSSTSGSTGATASGDGAQPTSN
jgi:hypothetical protein